MGRIRILPDHIANRIAAGEVISRPAAVVKELLDNAIDAGARHIEVTLRRGGRSLVQVTDDGCGMDADDALLAFERHATSKIQRPEDLDRIQTLGFRGEALASIAAVSHVILETREARAEAGTRVEIAGGRLLNVQPVGTPPGTRVRVMRLFFNTPARRKFLRAAATELARIVDIVQGYALAHPRIGFRVEHNGREVLFLPPASAAADRLRQVYGHDWVQQLLPVDFAADGRRVWGWISPPDRGHRTPDEVHLFVNRRVVRDRWLFLQLREVWTRYGARLPYPVAVLFLDVDPGDVDVNVHPTKLEVRFRDPGRLQAWLRTALDLAFRDVRPVPRVEPQQVPAAPVEVPLPTPPPPLRWQAPAPSPDAAAAPVTARAPVPEPQDTGTEPRVLGQFLDCYLVVAEREALLLLDQHLVHERYLYESWTATLRERPLPPQPLLVPVIVELGPARLQALLADPERLARWGWDLVAFGPGAVAVHAVPQGVWHRRIPEVVQSLAMFLEAPEPEVRDWEHDLVKTMACKAAVKEGMRLPEEQIRFLVRTWYTLKVPQVCPHGRTVAVRLTREQLHRIFGRTWNL